MAREVTLDVRDMSPPQPIVEVLDIIEDFGPGDRLSVVIDCEARPLFGILKRDGFSYDVTPGTESKYLIQIWRDQAART